MKWRIFFVLIQLNYTIAIIYYTKRTMEEDILMLLSRAIRSHSQIAVDDTTQVSVAPAAAPIVEQRIEPAPALAQQVQESDMPIETADDMSSHEHDINEFISSKSHHFDKLIPTTFGLNGNLIGVAFEESILIRHVGQFLVYPCIRAVCNDGTVSTADFDERVKSGQIDMTSVEKSERQHIKKKARARHKARKIHGDGKSFNSSILFWIHSTRFNVVYKIRLFRNGRFGLPGTRPDMVGDIINLRDKVFIPILAQALRAAYNMPTLPQITANELVPIMKNYKWRRILPENTILNLQQIVTRVNGRSQEYPTSPFTISYVQYGIDDTKLSIRLITPTPDKPKKSIRIKIFPSGKLNILGAHCSDTTKKICEYIMAILDDTIVVKNIGDDDTSSIEESPSNSDGEFSDTCDYKSIEEAIHRLMSLPTTSNNAL